MLSLTVLWGYAASTTLSAALRKFEYTDTYEQLGLPATDVVTKLGAERVAASMLLGRSSTAEAAYGQAKKETDAILGVFLPAIEDKDIVARLGDGAGSHLVKAKEALGGLQQLRTKVEDGRTDLIGVLQGYGGLIDSMLSSVAGLVSVEDVQVVQDTKSMLHLMWAHDLLMREGALMSSIRPGTRVDAAHRVAFAEWAGSRKRFFAFGVSGMDGELQKYMDKVVNSPEYQKYEQMEQSVLAGRTQQDPKEWRAISGQVALLWGTELREAGAYLRNEKVEPIGQRIITEFILAGGLGLLAVIASVLMSLRFARSVSRELRGLQLAAWDLARERLPRVVARLRRGEEVDSAAEAPPIDRGVTKEINEVAEAFDTVQHTAVDVAVAEAQLRKSVGQVFVNLSWRSQALLQRQLQLLDAMERRASSPEELDGLFKLDHLTTRMRRHAEGLVILSGAPTVRAWDHPVEMEDVVRAALGEVEEYTRVDTAVSSSVLINGDVVADVIHLLAELIENATMFSPPTTEVLVRAEAVANGVVVEIVDRGIGIYPDQMAMLNRNLADPPEFNLADSDRLGLFVVARLAAQHGIKVTLQPSAYGGTSAVVLLPESLVVRTGGAHARKEREPVRASRMSPAAPSASTTGQNPALPEGPATSSSGRYAPPSIPPSVPSDSNSTLTGGFDAYTGAVPETPAGLFPQPPAPAPAPEQGRGNGGRPGKLPRRNRQQHLAPQLRKTSESSYTGAANGSSEEDEGFVEPDPEFSRDLMSALQSGWLQGRGSDDETTEFETYDERERP
ncbi:nitrate- and nitrite sensing domain-containing protein [Actinocorallia sp. B10E7]|uniref:sensor histidine kinase n=1 Tax=Actinocorallia sp. B10E7 TaxID=3153558 RepID=UPI00325F07AC